MAIDTQNERLSLLNWISQDGAGFPDGDVDLEDRNIFAGLPALELNASSVYAISVTAGAGVTTTIATTFIRLRALAVQLSLQALSPVRVTIQVGGQTIFAGTLRPGQFQRILANQTITGTSLTATVDGATTIKGGVNIMGEFS